MFWDPHKEDISTFEVSRLQVHQWLYLTEKTTEGFSVDHTLLQQIFNEEVNAIKDHLIAEKKGKPTKKWLKMVDEHLEKSKNQAQECFMNQTFTSHWSRRVDRVQ